LEKGCEVADSKAAFVRVFTLKNVLKMLEYPNSTRKSPAVKYSIIVIVYVMNSRQRTGVDQDLYKIIQTRFSPGTVSQI